MKPTRLQKAAPALKIKLSNTIRLTEIPDAIRSDLTSRLQFTNPVWVENERMRRWNRGVPKTLKFFRKSGPEGLIVPRGLMRQLILQARRQNEPLQIEDRRRKLPETAFTFHGALRPYQQAAAEAMLARDFGTLSAPTGSGKTVIALSMIARRRQPTLIIVHNRELALQWVERIETFLSIPKSGIGLIGGGKKSIGEAVTVGLVQSVYKCAAEVAPRIGHLIVDECHRTPSRTFTEAVSVFDSHYMLGLSATPWRRDRLSKLIFWHLGDVHHEVQAAGLVADGQILDVEVVFRPTQFVPYADPINEYSSMLSELTHNDERNRLIAADVHHEVDENRRPGVCLVLSDRKRHCQVMQAILKHKYHIDAALLTGDLNMEQRCGVIEKLNAGHIKVLVATGQLIGEGFDCPRLSTLFLATPVRFSGRILQYLGRILRPSEGIDRARVYDYVDLQVAPLSAAARSRQRVYEGMKAGKGKDGESRFDDSETSAG